jgi:hypothetical protein
VEIEVRSVTTAKVPTLLKKITGSTKSQSNLWCVDVGGGSASHVAKKSLMYATFNFGVTYAPSIVPHVLRFCSVLFQSIYIQ